MNHDPVDVDLDWIDAGAGFQYIFFDTWGSEPGGILERHDCPGLTMAEAYAGQSVLFDTLSNQYQYPQLPRWTVDELHPLSLRENIVCRLCGLEGVLRQGIWYARPKEQL